MKRLFLEHFLDLVNFKYTKSTIKNYTENPNKNNLLGIIQTLRDIGIKCNGYMISEEKDFCDLKYPIISVHNHQFITILLGNDYLIQYIEDNHSYIVETSSFIQNWNGKIIEIESIDSYQEVNYKSHRLHDFFYSFSNLAIYILIPFILIGLGVLSRFWDSSSSVILLILYFVGACIACLSYAEYLNSQNKTAKYICSVIPDSNCNVISGNRAFKVFKIFHLSEIGLSFFIVNFISILIFNCNTKILSIYSLLSLPVCIWSLLYQKFVIHQWCTFCIGIITTSMSLFIFFAANGFYLVSDISVSFQHFLLFSIVGSSYIIFAIIINKFSSSYKKNKRYKDEVADYKCLKYNPIVFNSLLREGQKLSSRPPAPLVFGDQSSELVLTVVSNLFCISCVANHNNIKKLIKSNFRIEYVFTSGSGKLLEINSWLLSFYNKYGSNETWDLLSKWYLSGKNNNHGFFTEYQINVGKREKQMAIQQLDWIARENILSTPSNYLNGTKIPSIYSLSELQYLNISI